MKKILYILLFVLTYTSFAQNKEISLEDAVLGYYKGLYPKSLNNLQWVKNQDVFIYNDNGTLIFKEAKKNKQIRSLRKEDLVDFKKDLKYLPYIEVVTPQYIMFSDKEDKVLYNYLNHSYQKIDLPEEADNTDFNYKKNAVAYTIDNNLYVATTDRSNLPVTNFEDKNIVNGQAIARSEFGITKGTFWSPSGNKLAFYQKDESQVDDYPLVDITQTPAKLHNIKYPMNGRGSEEPGVGVYDINSGKTIFLKLFDNAGKNHYVTNLTWDPTDKYIYLAEVNRDQNHMWFNKYNAQSGDFVKTLFEEENDKWVEPEHPAFFIPNGKNEFIWLSERDGFMNLYKYNAEGKLIKQLTHNKWVTNDILGFSNHGKYVYITGTGKDPREKHLFRVDTRRGKIKNLTPQKGTHRVQLSDNGNYLLDRYSSINEPGKVYLADTKGKKQDLLFAAENPLKNTNLPKPELISIKGENGDVLYGRLFKPAHFDSSKKYPVLIYVYGGPHAQMVTNSWLAGASLWMPWMANQDYIVFTLDGHGSANRGFDFESVIHRRVGEVEMKDQLHGVDYLKSLPYVDPNRIAVHGWSFGGFMTSSLLTTYPEVFTTGVAGGPVTDWKWYEVMYGERYMDTEKQNPEGFKKTSVLNKIQNLKGKLLTIHGYQDDVVVPQHNIALHREAIKKGIQMDFYLYPTHKHNVRGRDRVHLMTKILNYIKENNK
jgi:dipeptidyl-peptidase-4